LLKQRIGDVQAEKPVGPQVERTTLAHLLHMVEADYKASPAEAWSGCSSLRRISGTSSATTAKRARSQATRYGICGAQA
jgi:hypothetical protein